MQGRGGALYPPGPLSHGDARRDSGELPELGAACSSHPAPGI